MAAPPKAVTLRELFESYAPYVWRILRRLGVREADLPDVCQEVFLVVHRKRHQFDERSHVRTWIYGISLRVASQYRRRAHFRHETATENPPEGLTDPTQEHIMDRTRMCAQLDAALGKLHPSKREVFVLYELEELTMHEVAIAVGCPLPTAYSRLHAARAELREAFQRSSLGRRGA